MAMITDIQDRLQIAWNQATADVPPLMPARPLKCPQHTDPREWLGGPASGRLGWIRTTCRRCGGFIGYRTVSNQKQHK